jgi:hypothetical protein
MIFVFFGEQGLRECPGKAPSTSSQAQVFPAELHGSASYIPKKLSQFGEHKFLLLRQVTPFGLELLELVQEGLKLGLNLLLLLLGRELLIAHCVSYSRETGRSASGYCGNELGPGGPAGPAGPGGPASPFSPFSPGSPLAPGSPFSPCGPVSPFSAVGP